LKPATSNQEKVTATLERLTAYTNESDSRQGKLIPMAMLEKAPKLSLARATVVRGNTALGSEISAELTQLEFLSFPQIYR
jgi:PII-like signaling protein